MFRVGRLFSLITIFRIIEIKMKMTIEEMATAVVMVMVLLLSITATCDEYENSGFQEITRVLARKR